MLHRRRSSSSLTSNEYISSRVHFSRHTSQKLSFVTSTLYYIVRGKLNFVIKLFSRAKQRNMITEIKIKDKIKIRTKLIPSY